MRRALAALATLLVALSGCSWTGGDDKDKTTTSSPTAAQPAKTATTKVEVVRPADDAVAKGKFDPETIYKTLSPGVVTIISLGGGDSPTPSGRGSLGSGFVVDPSGYVATNAHVVTSSNGKRAKDVYVSFADGNQLPATIVGTDLDSDVALLKIDPSHLRGPRAKIVVLPWGATSSLQVGDSVAAIGSPFGEQQSLSIGVVSALDRDIESLTAFRIGNAIQTDAAINHGNSGGPLLDADGKVIGINSQIRSTGGGGEGVGFAIPVETVKRSVEQLRTKGKVVYAYLGVSSVQLYPQLAERLGLKQITGSLLDRVENGGPGDKGGLRGAEDHITFQGEPRIPVGSDLIVAVDGRPLTQPDDLSDIIGTHNPGDTVQLTVVRGGKRVTIPVKLGARPQRSGAG